MMTIASPSVNLTLGLFHRVIDMQASDQYF
jgi:hypothetical protein